ncbi:hypothetical protein M2405_004288 [Rhodococcus erythropolis]|nr:hypothetical protein [Rhodococcus erythropolis]
MTGKDHHGGRHSRPRKRTPAADMQEMTAFAENSRKVVLIEIPHLCTSNESESPLMLMGLGHSSAIE